MIGDILARNLNTKIGDYLTILGSTVDGAVNAIDGKVIGIVKSGFDQMDSRLVQGNLKLAQGFKDSSDVTSMVILLEETEDTVRIQNLIEKKIKEKGLEVEILRWDQISDLYNKVTSLFTTIYQFINIIVVVIVLFTVSNTVSMNIMERINEIGTMRALGTTKFQIVFLFVLESFFLGLAGCIFGVIIGYVASEWINLLHIKLPPPPTRNEEYIVYIMFDLAIYLKTGFIILISMLSGLLASMRGVKFKIVDALRYV
jgi:putative ABC transport system permease protein